MINERDRKWQIQRMWNKTTYLWSGQIYKTAVNRKKRFVDAVRGESKDWSSSNKLIYWTSEKPFLRKQSRNEKVGKGFFSATRAQEKDAIKSKTTEIKSLKCWRKGSMHSLVPGPSHKSTTMRLWKLSNNAGKVGTMTPGAKVTKTTGSQKLWYINVTGYNNKQTDIIYKHTYYI